MQQQSLFEPDTQPEKKKDLPRPERVVLIDGHHLAYRNYFALERLTTSRGEGVQAIFGFIRTLLKLLREDGHCVIVVFDPPTRTFRHDNFEAYKAGRAPTPDDLPGQIQKIKEIVELMGLRRLEVPGYEADDVIGTLAKKAEREGYEVRIVTGDRDAFQLLSDRVWVWLPDGGVIGPHQVEEKYGVRVEQWVDYRALTGDPSDNIPGAKGIGPKGAARLLAEWGSLENLLAHLEEVKPERLRELLRASLEDIRLSYGLSKVRTDLPIDLDFPACHVREMNRERLRRELEALEFGSILRDLHLLEAPKPAEEAPWPPPAGAFLGFTMDRAQPMWATLTGLAAAWDGKVYRGPADLEELRRFDQLSALAAKDLAVLAGREGIDVPPGDDPMLLAYLYDPANSEPASTVRRYGAGDLVADPGSHAQAAWLLWETLRARTAGDERLWWLYREVEQPLAAVLAQMECWGVALDAPYLQELSEELGKELSYLEAEIHRLAGRPFNVNSRDQLEAILYDELKLQAGGAGRKTSTGKRSTAASVLEEMRALHPIVGKILDYRELSKLKSTYLDPLPRLIHPKTGRLHTRFNQTATATGRLSSSDPNLQNIPVRTEVGRKIRRGFVAQPGYQLVVADYSQIELRILAHLSGDENLKKVFTERRDIHTQTAAWMFGLEPEKVDPQHRRAAKTINFGVLYGMSAHRLSGELGISYAEASGFIERYFASYPKVRLWIERTLAEGRERGYVETMFGRRRFVADLESKNRVVKEAAERMAFNMPVQGTAADLMKLAMVKLYPKLKERGAHLVLQVHDELVVEAPEPLTKEVAEVMREVMQNVWELDVPLEVGVGIGHNWLEAK
ncbi:DNA polymerase I [Meiothermus sp. PNK-Is4]|uniref:DNA polymerase I n=1 Tax=unclassified Meiothermus TaxID=370471 RepID=UPI000D7BA8F3|nr:DNA polymerase I [Meiothermus sp. PNK-Is4]PZA05690.1 DNA polymerase I [Meiothermus sp. Pnk-1]RYM29938.1 DNA polymerase I [Meiothermus sp. PNK-Is4]